MKPFALALLAWFDRHGRHDLPWQSASSDGRRDAYRVWLSEIMLQQTQVATVVGYFERFVAALPTLRDLAAAPEDQVLALWSGLGYYRRARFLHQAAQRCVKRHGGALPRDFDALAALPGIGRSTAGAILAQAHGLRFPILDGNVKRVLARYHGIHGHPGASAVERRLWQHADAHTPAARTADYTQAIMDLGATVCTRTRPRCADCPLAGGCSALRDARGRVLLERRGPQGVWSGLWSLPEAADIDAAWRSARRHARIDDAQPLAAFTHVFSHYKLRIEPLLFDGASAAHAVADRPDLRWCDATALAALGLPAPVRKLLLQINDKHPPLAHTVPSAGVAPRSRNHP